MIKTALLLPAAMLMGCAAQPDRYQLSPIEDGKGVWRLDTWTGDLEACGFESDKPVCRPFPGPATRR
jgi:hypothetical protein